MKELERENAFYQSHKTEFHEKYYEKWLVISGETLWGVFDKFPDAAKAAYQSFNPGEFMIHTPSHDDIIIHIGPFISASNLKDNIDENLEAGITAIEGDLIKFTYAS